MAAVRVLGVVDTFTSECRALEVDTSFASPRVTRVLEGIIAERGRPQRLRMDNRTGIYSARQAPRERTRGELQRKAAR
jgi:putative transposase